MTASWHKQHGTPLWKSYRRSYLIPRNLRNWDRLIAYRKYLWHAMHEPRQP